MGQQELPSARPEGTATELPFPKASQVEPIVKEEQKPGVDLSFNDMTVVEEPNDPTALISSLRLEALATLPVVILDSSINDDDNKFTRGFTSAGVASSIQSLLTRYVNPALADLQVLIGLGVLLMTLTHQRNATSKNIFAQD